MVLGRRPMAVVMISAVAAGAGNALDALPFSESDMIRKGPTSGIIFRLFTLNMHVIDSPTRLAHLNSRGNSEYEEKY